MNGCQHAGATPNGYCPENRLCQRRLKSTTGEPGRWETMDLVACWSQGDDTWRRQVAPRQRRKGYETRVVTVAQAEAEAARS